VGPKIAAALIRHFKTIENLHARIAQTDSAALADLTVCLQGVKASPQSVLKKLRPYSLESLLLCRQLVTLVDNVELPGITSEARDVLHPLLTHDVVVKAHLKSLLADIHRGDELAMSNLHTYIFESFSRDPGVEAVSSPVKFSTDFLRYRGESSHCEELFEVVLGGGHFSSSLNLLRRQYHKLDRE
jgi:hypothetical protein